MFFQIKQNISSNCDRINRILRGIAYNSTVQNYMMEKDIYIKSEIFRDVDNLFYNTQETMDGIIDLVLISNSGKDYFLGGENNDIRKTIKSFPETLTNYYSKEMEFKFQDQNRKCFIVVTDVFSINTNKMYGQKIGMAAIIVDAKVLGVETNKKSKDVVNNIYLLDRGNNMYSGNKPSNINENQDEFNAYAGLEPGRYTKKINSIKYIIDKDDIPEIEGKIISIIPEKELFSDLNLMQRITAFMFLVALVLLMIPFIVIRNNILNPLKKFMMFISKIKSGDLKGLKERINLEGYEEMKIMVGEFNSLLDEIDHLTFRLVNTSTRLYEAELEKKQSELDYLKSQINPHFLYNTLETMTGCAAEEEAPRTMSMARALGRVFRYSIKGADIVTVNEELEIIKSYVQIQQIRFNDRFDVKYNFTKDILQYCIPKMILQPLVENAVFHGLETKRGKGLLCISGNIDERNNLNLLISDDGVGMDDDTLQRIRERLAKSGHNIRNKPENTSNIGIINVNNRIKLIYGDEYGIEINSMQGQGTEVLLMLPAGKEANSLSAVNQIV
jgi:Putative regulator of cell autolysis